MIYVLGALPLDLDVCAFHAYLGVSCDNVWRHADCSTKLKMCEAVSASERGGKKETKHSKIRTTRVQE